ncbi:hypothetical protein [Streptomyces sp. CC208A]|uniref:hypothetical protein n=1 Tax=Streptomyces sp. CC208A TaxID=3044573 RepID=UPI0024A7A704|nr:hypothetical protein [Streptomyces sp. CC208A]
MHRRASAALSFAALAALAVSGCAKGSASPAVSDSAPAAAGKPAAAAKPAEAPLSSAALSRRLLDESDLGQGYTRQAKTDSGDRDDVTVIGCPALEKLGGDGAAGGDLDFPNSAKATFSYTRGPGSEVTEELYSDTVAKLAPGTRTVFEAMTGCPVYQVVVGDAPIAVTTQKLPAPALGDEAWSQLLTFTAGGRDTVMKQTAVRTGSVLVVVSGSPALVDTHLARAVDKARG